MIAVITIYLLIGIITWFISHKTGNIDYLDDDDERNRISPMMVFFIIFTWPIGLPFVLFGLSGIAWRWGIGRKKKP